MHRRKMKSRRATATVECALCLPLVFTLTVATIDLCSAMFIRESLTLAAYEGARIGIAKGNTNAEVTARIEEFLVERGVEFEAGNTVSFGSPDFNTADTLDNVTVTVSVPCTGNLLGPDLFFGDRQLTASITMRKEYRNL